MNTILSRRLRARLSRGALISLLLLLSLTLLLSSCRGTTPGDSGTTAESLSGAADTPTLPEAETQTEPPAEQPTDPATQGETEPETPPAPLYDGLVDFVVNVETGREIRVLQLTDTQVIDAAQCRRADRLDYKGMTEWAHDRIDFNYKQYVRDVIAQAQPDLIIMTGDLVYGEFDDSGEVFADFVAFMDSFGIPWAPVFGNHDNESKKGVDWQCEQFVNAKNCLFVQRELTGNGNYTVGIAQGGELLRVFFMMDSNGCGAMSAESKANGHSTTNVGFGNDQVTWFTKTAQKITEAVPSVHISFAFHIQPAEFAGAFSGYGFVNGNTQSKPINIDAVDGHSATDFGYMGRDLKSPWNNPNVWKRLVAIGTDSVFVGHEHCNSGSVVVDGIRYQYGMKSSTYDRLNYLQPDGSIVGGYNLTGKPLVGGTLMTLAEGDGAIKEGHIVYAATEEVKPAPLPDLPEASVEYRLDFNGTDFDLKVTTDGVKNETCAAPSNGTPDGASGAAAIARETYLVAVGVKLPAELDFDQLASFRVRIRATESSKHSKDPLFRLYNDRDNNILSSNTYLSVGGVFGEWSEIELLPLIKEAKLNKNGVIAPFTIVYRCYDADTVVEFDCLIIEAASEISGMPAGSMVK